MNPVALIIITLLVMHVAEVTPRDGETSRSIVIHRKGQIPIKTEPVAGVRGKQQSHEFWFGSAIASSIFSGSASESDRKQYKEKFFENYNSAVEGILVAWVKAEGHILPDI